MVDFILIIWVAFWSAVCINGAIDYCGQPIGTICAIIYVVMVVSTVLGVLVGRDR